MKRLSPDAEMKKVRELMNKGSCLETESHKITSGEIVKALQKRRRRVNLHYPPLYLRKMATQGRKSYLDTDVWSYLTKGQHELLVVSCDYSVLVKSPSLSSARRRRLLSRLRSRVWQLVTNPIVRERHRYRKLLVVSIIRRQESLECTRGVTTSH